MIYRTVKTTNKTYKLKIPESWEEVTYGTFTKILDKNKGEQLLAAVLGVDDDLFSIENSVDLWSELSKTCAFIFNKEEFKEKPKSIYIKGEIVYPNSNILKNSIAQYEDCKAIIKTCEVTTDKGVTRIDEKKLIKSYDLIFSIYLQQQIDNEYDGQKALDLRKHVNDLPCGHVISWSSFFLNKLFKKKKNSAKTYLKRKIKKH